jgi:hypothetical protein
VDGGSSPGSGGHRSALSLLLVAAGFALSRLGFWWLGIRFDATPLGRFWQFVEPRLLTEDLWRSLYYLHSQPPLFNAFLGLALKLAGRHYAVVLSACYLVFGLALHLTLCALLLRLKVNRWVAVGAVLLFACSPAVILYENWLFYTYPMALTLAAGALFTHRLAEGGRFFDASMLFVLLAVAAFTRAIFHLAWLLLIVAVLACLLPKKRRLVLLVASPALLLLLVLYTKNWVEFGIPTSSSWVGMNLAKLTTFPLSPEERTSLVQEGRVSPLALIVPFSPLDRFPAEYRRPAGPDVPVLQRERKANGRVNYHHLGYVRVSMTYLADGLTLMKEFPGRYLGNVGRAWLHYLMPPTEYRFLRWNRRRILELDRIFSMTFYGADPRHWRPQLRRLRDRATVRELVRRCSWLWLVCGSFSLVYGILRAVRTPWRETGSLPERLTLLFVALQIVFVAVVGNALDLGENNRFRMMTDPLLFVLMTVAVSRLANRVRCRLGRVPSKVRGLL